MHITLPILLVIFCIAHCLPLLIRCVSENYYDKFINGITRGLFLKEERIMEAGEPWLAENQGPTFVALNKMVMSSLPLS